MQTFTKYYVSLYSDWLKLCYNGFEFSKNCDAAILLFQYKFSLLPVIIY